MNELQQREVSRKEVFKAFALSLEKAGMTGLKAELVEIEFKRHQAYKKPAVTQIFNALLPAFKKFQGLLEEAV